MTRSGALVVVIAAAAGAALGACTTERVVARRGLLSGISGVESGVPDARGGRAAAPNGAGAPSTDLRRTDEAGEVMLISRSVRDVMVHVVTTLRDGEEELFLSQVLSERTRAEFLERGHDPVWAFRELKRRERDVRRLYAVMPMGEYTPGLRLEQVGQNEFRLRVRSTDDLSWEFVDVVVEHGAWRLRWFGA